MEDFKLNANKCGDDYIEKVAVQPFQTASEESYWRKIYAGMAMQGLCAAHGTTKSAEHIARGAVECAYAIIEELKK